MLPTVSTGSVRYLRALSGTRDWFWGINCTDGDLYEAEELWQLRHKVDRTRLILVRDGDRRVFEPVLPRAGQYFGVPFFHAGAPLILLADFPAGVVRALRFDAASGETTPVLELPRSAFADCYNLQLHASPLMLTRQTGGQPISPSSRRRALIRAKGSGSISPAGTRRRITGRIPSCAMRAPAPCSRCWMVRSACFRTGEAGCSPIESGCEAVSVVLK